MVNATAFTIELWMQVGGLVSTQEARVTLALSDAYTSFVLSNLLHVSITQ